MVVSLSVLILILVGFLSRYLWVLLFSATFSYVVFDALLSVLVIRGGGGYAVIPLSGEHFRCEAHSYIAFLTGIIVGTLVASFYTDVIERLLEAFLGWYVTLLGLSASIGLLIFLDLYFRFYAK